MEKEMKIGEGCSCATSQTLERTKLSYEQLENVANQVTMQNHELRKRVQQLDMSNFFKRLDYLWDIIHSDSEYLTEEFKKQAGEEYMEMMAKPEEPEAVKPQEEEPKGE